MLGMKVDWILIRSCSLRSEIDSKNDLYCSLDGVGGLLMISIGSLS